MCHGVRAASVPARVIGSPANLGFARVPWGAPAPSWSLSLRARARTALGTPPRQPSSSRRWGRFPGPRTQIRRRASPDTAWSLTRTATAVSRRVSPSLGMVIRNVGDPCTRPIRPAFRGSPWSEASRAFTALLLTQPGPYYIIVTEHFYRWDFSLNLAVAMIAATPRQDRLL